MNSDMHGIKNLPGFVLISAFACYVSKNHACVAGVRPGISQAYGNLCKGFPGPSVQEFGASDESANGHAFGVIVLRVAFPGGNISRTGPGGNGPPRRVALAPAIYYQRCPEKITGTDYRRYPR
jgi:hypothetical protein